MLGEQRKEAFWSNHPDAQDVHIWLAEMAASSPKCLDIMVERKVDSYSMFPAPRSKNERGELFGTMEEVPIIRESTETLNQIRSNSHNAQLSGLDATVQLFKPCEGVSRLNCFGKAVRYHNVDIRGVDRKRYIFCWEDDYGNEDPKFIIAHIWKQIKMNSGKLDSLWKGNALETNLMFNIDDMETKRLFLNSLWFLAGYDQFEDDYGKFVELTIRKICEYDSSIDYGKMSAKAHVTFMKHAIIAKIKKSAGKIDQASAGMIVKLLLLRDFHNFGSNLWVAADAFVIECYGLFRMFAKYDMSKRGPQGCERNEYAENIIWYGDVKRTINMCTALEGLGYKSDVKNARGTMNADLTPFEDPKGPNYGLHSAYVTLAEPFDFWKQ
jgi:hypothetical protein